jgi:cell fate regulator YaaT (PSP1 superfamily)
VEKGQYVVVQGDRGIDVGVVIRVNTDSHKSYVERTGPNGSILRHATQREVDYWAIDLKADEAAAVETCQQRVLRLHLNMEVRHAEYQFDKKKLTFYYDAKARVDFVQLLKELYREYGCRIWMEKVRAHE